MALDPVPWFIGGGAEHSADVARLLVHVATGGAAGVVSPTDMRVTQLPAATDKVRVAAGACIVPNTEAVQQSYALRAPSITDLNVTPTGSVAGRSDMVVAYVSDPQFTGEAIPDGEEADWPYVNFALIEGVSAGATTVPATFEFPAIPLARLDLPINTAAVTQGMIADLREVAVPKRSRDLYNTQPSAASSLTSSSFVAWTPQANRNIRIPEWATQVKVVGTVAGARAYQSALVGLVRFKLGTLIGQEVAVDMDAETRHTVITSDTFAIPADLRGTTLTLSLDAKRLSGTGTLFTDAYSTVLWDVEFLEVPSAD